MKKILFLAVSLFLMLNLASAAGTLEVTTQDSSGNRLSNVRLDITGASDTTAYTDSTGSTEINRLNQGEHTITASKSGYNEASTDFSIDYYGDIEDATLELEEETVKRGEVTITVSDQNGNPIDGARIEVEGTSEGASDTTAYTDGTGETTISRLKIGTYDVQASKDGSNSDIEEFSIDYQGDKENTNLEIQVGKPTLDLVADFSYSPKSPKVEEWVDFDASNSEGNIESYHWNFGDGDTYNDNDPQVKHRYNNPGSYKVELTVENKKGNTDTTTKTIKIQEKEEPNEPPEINLKDPNDGETINLPYTLRWSVDDPNHDDVESTVYIGEERDDESTLDEEYIVKENVGESESFRLESSDLDEGDYIWGVKAKDETGKTTWSKVRSFTVKTEEPNIKPTADFSYSPENPEVEEWVEFDASESESKEGIESYHWDFGDGGTYTDDDPVVKHRYNNPGSYKVELTVENKKGNTDTFTKSVDVSKQPTDNKPAARFSYYPGTPEVDETVTFDASSSEDNIENFEWEFGDGSSASGETTEHAYEQSGSYQAVLTVENEEGKTDTRTRTIRVSETELKGPADLNVYVKDTDGEPLEDAKVVLDQGNWFSLQTDSQGEADFEVDPVTSDLTVSKEGYRTESRTISFTSVQKSVEITLEERDRSIDEASLEVHVEDDEYDELEDAKVTVENGDHEIEYTDSNGDSEFDLKPDDYDIEVECNDEKEYRNVDLDEGEDETVDIRFDKEFDSDVCGEDETNNKEDNDIGQEDSNTDEDGLAITDVSYPNSVCRGGSFVAEVEIENRGGFHELVTLTGSGLGSINTGHSFSLDIAETKSASVRFTNVEGSGTEDFDIRATNHDSDETTETINVRDCGITFPDTEERSFTGTPTGITAEVSPKKTVVGKAVKVKGYVDGVRGRSQVTIRANGERKATVSTEPDGYYSTFIRVDEVGDNIIRVRTGQAETSSVVEVIPTSTVSGIKAPNKVFNSERFEICANVDSQIEPKVFLLKNNEIVDSKFGTGEVCFQTEASETGEQEYQINTLTYGRQSSSTKENVEVLELGSEVTNFPDKVATTESEEGMVKVELYNTNNESRRYKVKLNGIRTNWLSQSQKEVYLTKGERETVYFYITPEDEGTFEPIVTVVSEDTTIYSEELSVYAGGTKNPKPTSFFERLSQIFRL